MLGHFKRDNGASLVNALYATIRAIEFNQQQLNNILIDGLTFIPARAAAEGTLFMIEEVCVGDLSIALTAAVGYLSFGPIDF